ncbi:MAG TPA: tRNA lysidine(34) synthetase TilS [Vicinamibacterales bacterium]|jgi:tRNA(Ile)-lysidine synthase
MDPNERVRRTIRRYGLAPPGTRVLVALSGGSDSVALAHLVASLDAAGELHLAAFAHFNHQLRASADADERFCREVAASLGRPLLADRGDVRAVAARQHRSIEDAARTARHAFLERARLESGADVVALGHTKDDQAETFLLRLIRGAGARGLAAMHPRRDAIIRPLIDCRRADLRAYLAGRGLAFVDDETNEDVSVPRNRVRAELLPLLEARFNVSVVDALADAADIAREEWAWMSSEARAASAGAVSRDGDRWMLDAAVLAGRPVPLLRLVVYETMTAAAGGRPIGFDDVDRAVELLRSGGPPFDAHGQRVERIASRLVLTGRPADAVGRPRPDPGLGSLLRLPLSIPGEVALADSGFIITAELAVSTLPGAAAGNRSVALVRRDLCGAGLAVRYRRPGDRFRPAGLNGGKKLQDFFVDRKVERAARDRVPIVVDEADRIVWVAGHAIDEEFRVTDPAQAVLILRLKGLGGSD